ncbi:MAG TPA: ABC transporter permease [Mycobacteriales bacterium]
MTQVADRDAAFPAGPEGATVLPELPLTKVGRPSLWASRELIINLTRREVAGKYKRTTLGHVWSLLNPLATMLVYTLVFAVILKTKPDRGEPSGLHNYALYLMCGLLPWSFFSNSVTGGMFALIGNSNLVQKVYFRRDVLVSSQVFSLLVTFLFEMLVLVVALLGFGGMPLPWIPIALVVIVLLTFLGLGFALLLSVANVYFRDTQHFVSIAFQLWFYLTPIIYPLSLVQRRLHTDHLLGVSLYDIYELNPLTRFIQVLRNLLYDNHFPAWGDLAYCLGSTVVALVVGGLVFSRFEGRLAEEL